MMIERSGYTASELLAVMSARLLMDGQCVFAGVGIPLLAATLAQRLHGPGLTILFEGGVLGPFVVPGELPPSTNEQRCTKRANMLLSITDVLLLLQRGYVDVGFMGGAQIDQYGNLNSSFIGDPDAPAIRLPGTGGGNDISSLTQVNRLGFLVKALEVPGLDARLVYGTDWPLQFFPLVSPYFHLERVGASAAKTVARIGNPWDRDLALKEALGTPRSVFARSAALLDMDRCAAGAGSSPDE